MGWAGRRHLARRHLHQSGRESYGAMTRILVAECKQEVSSFNPAASHKEDFRFAYGADVLRRGRSGQSELAGALSVFETRADVELVPAFSAVAISSAGVLAA